MKLIYLQGQQENPDVTHIIFPTGEKHIRIRNLSPDDRIVLYNGNPTGDLMKLGMAVDICQRACVASIKLVMPFMPYARQDRVVTDGDPVSVAVFARFINMLDLDQVVITDPHSDRAVTWLNKVKVIHQWDVATQAVIQLKGQIQGSLALVAPDKGSQEKVRHLRDHLERLTHRVHPIIQCDKTRDKETGKITGFKILDGTPSFNHCLMVDDICDGGGTFLGLAKVLEAAGANRGQSLYVTHGIFSKGVADLSAVFHHIFTSDSFPSRRGVQTIELGIPTCQSQP